MAGFLRKVKPGVAKITRCFVKPACRMLNTASPLFLASCDFIARRFTEGILIEFFPDLWYNMLLLL